MRRAKELNQGKLLAGIYRKRGVVAVTTSAHILIVSRPFVNPQGHEFSHQGVTPDA